MIRFALIVASTLGFVLTAALGNLMTPLLRAAQARGCAIQRGTAMLFEMIPAYLRFFSLRVATPERLRELAEIRY